MMALILVAKSMEKELLDGLIMLHLKETFLIIISMEWVPITGQMGESTQEIGKTTKWMEKEFLNGLMAEDTRVLIRMTKNLAKVYLNGKI